MIKKFIVIIYFSTVALYPSQAKTIESCFKEASNKHNVPLHLLLAVSYTESRFKTKAHNKNRNGTRDYGLMQINSIWSKQAKKMGYSWYKIKTNPCTNIMFGSHILKSNHRRLGSWKSAIGAYNAGFAKSPKAKKRRQHYYRLVMRHRYVAQRHFKKVKKKIT